MNCILVSIVDEILQAAKIYNNSAPARAFASIKSDSIYKIFHTIKNVIGYSRLR
jgi:hypothetical protein